MDCGGQPDGLLNKTTSDLLDDDMQATGLPGEPKDSEESRKLVVEERSDGTISYQKTESKWTDVCVIM